MQITKQSRQLGNLISQVLNSIADSTSTGSISGIGSRRYPKFAVNMFLARQDTAAPFPMMSNLPPVSLESRGSFIITITAIFTGFACTAVLARLYVRAYMLKKVGIDDYILIVSMACTAAVLAFTIKEVRLGVGEHWGNPHQLFNLQEIFHWSYFHAWIIVLGNSSVKLSVGFFLLRLVQGRWYKVCMRQSASSGFELTTTAVHHCLDCVLVHIYSSMSWNIDISVPSGKRCLEYGGEAEPKN